MAQQKINQTQIGKMGYVSNASTASTTLTQSNQTIASVDVSHFPVGAELEICGSVHASGDGNLVALVASTNVTPAYSQAQVWGRSVSFVEPWVKTSGTNIINLLARKDNAAGLTVVTRSLTVKFVGGSS